MAGAVAVDEPTSFAEILEIVESFQTGTSVSWYRGCRNEKHSLAPSLYRHSSKKAVEEISKLETEVNSSFSQRSLPFVGRQLVDDWDRLFLMQHYGVPTRLLDWSENPFVALYFALSTPAAESDADAALWLCDPETWNQAALSHLSYGGGVLSQTSDEARYYAPDRALSQMPNYPVMMYGQHNSARIVAQRGVFGLFGQGLSGMEAVVANGSFPDGALKKVVIKNERVDDLRASLFRKGFSESVVFPDLDGLAKEIKRKLGF